MTALSQYLDAELARLDPTYRINEEQRKQRKLREQRDREINAVAGRRLRMDLALFLGRREGDEGRAA